MQTSVLVGLRSLDLRRSWHGLQIDGGGLHRPTKNFRDLDPPYANNPD